jgi:hypothetical protein
MLSFMCSTLACIQTYLGGIGAGNVIMSSENFLIYATYNKEYVCNVTNQMYACTSRNLINK